MGNVFSSYEGRTGQDRAGQGRAGQGRAGQGRTGHSCSAANIYSENSVPKHSGVSRNSAKEVPTHKSGGGGGGRRPLF